MKYTLAVTMWQLTKEQRVFMLKYFFTTRSCVQVIQLFGENFPDREPPTKMTIWRNVQKYSERGTSLNINSGRSGRPRTGRSQQNIDRVQQLLIDNPRGVSGRRNGLGLPQATFS